MVQVPAARASAAARKAATATETATDQREEGMIRSLPLLAQYPQANGRKPRLRHLAPTRSYFSAAGHLDHRCSANGLSARSRSSLRKSPLQSSRAAWTG